MNKVIYDKMICGGIYDMVDAILNDPDLKRKRTKLINNSSVELCSDDQLVLYVDSSYLPNGKGDPRIYQRKLSEDSLFAVLRTPVVDITVSNGKIHEITFTPENALNKMPHEIDLELVLKEVDRVAFSKNAKFDARRALASEPKKKREEPREGWGYDPANFQGDSLRGGGRITIEDRYGQRHRLEARDISIQAEHGYNNITSMAPTWSSSAMSGASLSAQVNIQRESTYIITARDVR